MKCLKPYYDKKRQQTFNCGQCRNCRVNRTSSWALRCLYELADWNCASFITLTYNDENLPADNTLNPEHLKKFWKDVRYDLSVLDKQRKIKYYACGEYGDKEKKYWSKGAKRAHGRPHYHAIVFGLDPFNDKDREIISSNWNYCDSWIFDKNRQEKAIDEVNVTDISYVTGYVQKKLNGDSASEEYGDAVRPFSRSSAGIGLNFALKNKDRLVNNGFTYIGNGKKIGIPRYFREKFNVSAYELLNNTGTKSREKFEIEQSYLFELFVKDMKKRNTWYPDNEKMLAIRFERWLDNFQFELAKQVEKDFLQKQHMTRSI